MMSTELGPLVRLPRALLALSLAGCLLVAAAPAEGGVRAKRQLSPAIELDSLIDSFKFLRGARSADHKRHVAPSSDIFAEFPPNMRELIWAGKRSISPAAELESTASHLRTLGAIGKRSGFSPSADAFAEIPSNYGDLALIGKRHIAPSLDVPMADARLRQLIDIGKRSSPVVAPSFNDAVPSSRLLEVGKRSNPLAPSLTFNDVPSSDLIGIGKRSGGGVLAPSLSFNDVRPSEDLDRIGKRSAPSPAMEIDEMGNVYSFLNGAGKRGALSPAADLDQEIQFRNFMDAAGRR